MNKLRGLSVHKSVGKENQRGQGKLSTTLLLVPTLLPYDEGQGRGAEKSALMPALSLQRPLCPLRIPRSSAEPRCAARPSCPPLTPGGLKAQPTCSSTGSLSGQIEATVGKTGLQQSALNCWCFCGTLAVRNLQRGTAKAKGETCQREGEKGALPGCRLHDAATTTNHVPCAAATLQAQ